MPIAYIEKPPFPVRIKEHAKVSTVVRKINMEPDAKPVVDHQRRLNPKMKEVVRMEILKLLEAGIIYPIADSRWVRES